MKYKIINIINNKNIKEIINNKILNIIYKLEKNHINE